MIDLGVDTAYQKFHPLSIRAKRELCAFQTRERFKQATSVLTKLTIEAETAPNKKENSTAYFTNAALRMDTVLEWVFFVLTENICSPDGAAGNYYSVVSFLRAYLYVESFTRYLHLGRLCLDIKRVES